MISFYKWKKYAVFITLGIIPLIIFMLVFFPTIRFFTFEGMQLMYLDFMWVMISIIAAVITAIILVIIGNRFIRHAFTDMLEGKGLITLILDSTGVIGSFNVKVNAPKITTSPTRKNTQPLEDTYDMDLLHRLVVPQTIGMTQAISFKKDEDGKIVQDKLVDVLVLPDQDEKYDYLFMFENRPVFIFNKVMGKFLSRDALAKYEKDIEIKHNALNILKKIQDTAADFKHFGRYAGEIIRPKKHGLFASPIIKYIIIAAIVGLIFFVILLFVPGILQATSNLSFP